jgi:hypothetical protein
LALTVRLAPGGAPGKPNEATEKQERAMSIALILARPGSAISLSEWTRLVEEDDDLRLRSEPYVAINPSTRAKISIKTGEADAEFLVNGQWVPFLRYRKGGDLATKFVQEFNDPQNATRLKIASIATLLGALITTDAGDEVLSW